MRYYTLQVGTPVPTGTDDICKKSSFKHYSGKYVTYGFDKLEDVIAAQDALYEKGAQFYKGGVPFTLKRRE